VSLASNSYCVLVGAFLCCHGVVAADCRRSLGDCPGWQAPPSPRATAKLLRLFSIAMTKAALTTSTTLTEIMFANGARRRNDSNGTPKA